MDGYGTEHGAAKFMVTICSAANPHPQPLPAGEGPLQLNTSTQIWRESCLTPRSAELGSTFIWAWFAVAQVWRTRDGRTTTQVW